MSVQTVAAQTPALPTTPTFTGRIYAAAATYNSMVEGTASVAYDSIDAFVSCVDAMTQTTAKGWNLGLKKSLKECAKWSLGIKDFQKAFDAIQLKPTIKIDDPSLPIREIVDRRPFSQRLGQFFGHTINGSCKAVASGVGAVCTTAFAVGTASNAMSWEPAYQFGDFHRTSRLFASGASGLGRYMLSFGWGATKLGAKAGMASLRALANHPTAATNVTGMGALLYDATYNIEKAGKDEGSLRKVGHLALATLFGAGAIAFPFYNPVR